MKSKIISLLVLLLISSPILSSTQAWVNDVKISDKTIQKEIEEPLPRFSDIELDVGNFEEPITISLPPGNETQSAIVKGELNATHPALWFSVDIAAGSLVRINLTTTTSFDPAKQDIFFDVLSPNGEYIGGNYDDFVKVQTFEFPAVDTGKYLIFVFGSGENPGDAPFGPSENIIFDLGVTTFLGGKGPAGGTRVQLESKATKEIFGILEFFVEQGYVINPDNGSYNLQRLNPQISSDYPKAIASAVFGLLRGGDYIGHLGLGEQDLVQFPSGNLNETLPFFLVSRNLVKDTFKQLVTLDDSIDSGVTHRLFFDASKVNITDVSANGGTLTFSLQDNIYLLLAMLEVRQWIEVYSFPDAPQGVANATELAFYDSQIKKLADSIATYFFNGTYFYDYVSSAVGIPTAGNYTSTAPRDFTYNRVSLESLALMPEILDRVDELLPVDHSATNNQVVNFILNNMMVKSVSYAELEGVGVGAEYIILSNKTLATTSDLLGNTYLASILTNDTTRINRNYANLTKATEVAKNILTIMSSDKTGMLYDRVSLTSTVYRKVSSLINMMQYINYLNRLSNSWRNVSYLSKVSESVSRTWQIRSLTLEQNIEEKMFDNSNNAFFAQYDEDADLLLINDENYDQNQFVANAMAIAQQIKRFPINVEASGQAETTVGVDTQISIRLTNILTIGSWVWFDPKVAFDFDLTISIKDFGYSETRKISLFDLIFGSSTPETITSFVYAPTERGRYNITIEATKEGNTLLSQSFELIAYGEVQAEVNTPLSFSTDDTEFTATFSLIDENGLSIQNLYVEAALAEPIGTLARITTSDRSDASGEVSLNFDVTNFEKLFVNRTKFNSLASLPKFLTFPLFVNVTNLDSMNLKIPNGLIVVEVKVVLARTVIQVSPTRLEVTQGTTESYSFEVGVFNQNFDPVQNAKIQYVVEGFPESRNLVATDVDGAATITLRDALLVQLVPPSVNITFVISHDRYPARNITRTLIVKENSINIIANPVQYSIKGKTIFESSIPAIDVEVMTEDRFGQAITSMISLSWSDPAVNNYVDVVSLGERISPQTFTLDPTKLPAGTYELQISAWKEGLVPKESPVVVSRTIIITAPTLYDSVASAFLIYGVYILSKIGGAAVKAFKKKLGIIVDCPHCLEETLAKAPMCSNCGNSIKKY